MKQILTLFIILIPLFLAVYLLREYINRQRIKARVAYGFSQENVNAEVDLAAEHYGLTGQMMFYYNLKTFISSVQGKFILFSVGMFVASSAAYMMSKPIKSVLTVGAVGGIALVLIGMMAIIVNRKEQENAIRLELPNALQTIAAIMEGGLAFETAVTHVVSESDVKHPLYFDLAIMLEAMQRGRRRNEALKLWAERSKVTEVSEVVAGLIQADQTGASLGTVLKQHGKTLLKENESRIERSAERLPVKMLFPMATMILPAVMIIAAGPSMVRIFQIFKELMSKA